MCFHRYTEHPCGHPSTSIGKCTIDILATAVPFCDHYNVVKDKSLDLCGGDYCKEDKDTAHWVENGSALLTACEDDLAYFKHRLQTLFRLLQAFEQYKQAFGVLQENDMDRARTMHDEYEALRHTYWDTKARRQLITDGIQKAKQKQQAVVAEKMRRVQQYIDGLKPSSAHPPSPQSIPRTIPTHASGLVRRTSSGLWETGDTSATPCRPPTKLVSPVKRKPKSSNLSAPTTYSPPSLASPFAAVAGIRKTAVVPDPTPPKKRRGRPPKASKVADVESQPSVPFDTSIHDVQINNDDSSMAGDQHSVSKSRSTKRSNKKGPSDQTLASSGVRRSERAKQRISYAESPTSSPERPAPDEFEPDAETAPIGQPQKSTRVTRKTSGKSKPQKEDFYATEEEDEDKGMDDDDEWQADGDVGEDDMDFEPTPVQKTRSNAKRAAASPPMDSRSLKRQARAVCGNTRQHDSSHHDEMASPDKTSYHMAPELGNRWTHTTAQSKNPAGVHNVPSTSYNNMMAVGNRSKLQYHTNPMADGVTLNATNHQSQILTEAEMSPLRRSDWMNGLDMADMALSLDNVDDPNDYDFDVNAMSRIIAELDAQQS
ncbi:hypothetical protein E4T49_01362 [Aureobasidium sp. EXF-10728]|nr:hypothetical protein E4T49_01362 [Aureobasidium sp. EXF-10728]